MAARPINDPVVRRFRAALDGMYGDQIDRVVIFGPRARGDAHSESGYDVAVFDRLADLRLDFLDRTGASFDTKAYPTTADQQRTPLMREIRRDGVEL